MAIDPRLESYLNALDRRLAGIPTSDRAEIITEIKSHVLEAQSREPARALSEILSSLGEPESVANKYLLERGLKPGKASKSPIVKWLTIGFLGTFGISALLLLVMIWKFTPLISITDEKVALLGGAIQIDGATGAFAMGSAVLDGGNFEKNARRISGSKTIADTKGFEFVLPFTNGKLEIGNAPDQTLRWECKYLGAEGGVSLVEEKKRIALNAEKASGIDCEIELPKGVAIDVRGSNGKVEIERPSATTRVKLSNGKVTLTPDASTKYHYDLRVSVGRIAEGFETAQSGAGVVPVSVELGNGEIERL